MSKRTLEKKLTSLEQSQGRILAKYDEEIKQADGVQLDQLLTQRASFATYYEREISKTRAALQALANKPKRTKRQRCAALYL